MGRCTRGVAGAGCADPGGGAVAPHLLGRFERGPLMVGVLLAGLPLVLSAIMIAESLAGERERRTLETLLASRLSERAILLRKMSAAVLLGWMLLLAAAAPVILQQWLAPAAGFEQLNPATLAWGCWLWARLASFWP